MRSSQQIRDIQQRQQAIALTEGFPLDFSQGSDLAGGSGSGAGALLQGIVVAHGEPDPVDDRIYTHLVRPLIFTDHKTPPVYDGRDNTDPENPPDPPVVEFEVSPFEIGGWFHVGQIIEFQPVGLIHKAHCASFMGMVTGVRYEDGVDPALDPRDTVEITPFDGDITQAFPSSLTLYDGTEPLNGIGDGRVPQVAMMPGAGLAIDDPVLCVYTGQPGRAWVAMTMLDITGDPASPTYAFREPTSLACGVSDPELPVLPPPSDDLNDAFPEVQPQ